MAIRPRDRLTRPPLVLAAALLLAGLVGACAAGGFGGAWDLAGHPGLLFKVKRYYERNAVEEFGTCRNPLFEGVTEAAVLEETPERLVVRVGYYYRDLAKDWDEGCDARPGAVLQRMCRAGRVATTPCRGYAARTFTIDMRGEELAVATMTGERR